MMLNPTFYKPNNNKQENARGQVNLRPLYEKRVRAAVSQLLNAKLIVSALFFLLLFSSFLLISSNAATVNVSPAISGEYEIIVDSGDTLWSIAKSRINSGTDVRYVVFLIQQRNGLQDADIKPGQKLIIPKL